MNFATRRNFVFSHTVSRLNYIMPFVSGHPLKVQKKVTAIWVRAAKFIYGQDTTGLLHDELFTRVNFPLKSNIYEAFSSAWMPKSISSGQPDQIIDLIRLPRSREKCTLTPHQNTRSGRFERSAIINGITNYNIFTQT